MRLSLPAIILTGLALEGCTAIGAWVYEDPVFTLRAAAVRNDSLDLVFVVCNRNDYDVRADQFKAQVAVAGEVVAVGGLEQPLFLSTRDSSRFTVTVPLRDSNFKGDGKKAWFDLTTSEVLSTPMGDRSAAGRFRGRVTRQAGSLKWSSEPTLCRPGLSTLPQQFDTRPLTGKPPPKEAAPDRKSE